MSVVNHEQTILTLPKNAITVGQVVDEKTKEGLQKWTCSICMELYNDPIQLNNHEASPCQHFFCRGCITKHLLVNDKCPTCRMPTLSKHIIPASFLSRDVGDIKLFCTYKAKGCEWSRSMGPDGRDYLAHVRQCPQRGKPCSDCKELVPWGADAKTKHNIICTERLRDCSYCHSFKGKQIDLKLHQMTACEEFPLDCEFKSYGLDGCEKRMLRKDYLRHCTTNMTQHANVCDKFHKMWVESNKELTSTKRKMEDMFSSDERTTLKNALFDYPIRDQTWIESCSKEIGAGNYTTRMTLGGNDYKFDIWEQKDGMMTYIRFPMELEKKIIVHFVGENGNSVRCGPIKYCSGRIGSECHTDQIKNLLVNDGIFIAVVLVT